MLRSHQKQMLEIARELRGGASWTQIIAQVTPGGGKSLLPVILSAELIPKIAKKICWVVPRVALQQQAEEAFIDPQFRSLLKHRHSIRVSTNDRDPSRGLAGFATTYAALSIDSQGKNASEFERHPYILVLDEPHHIAEDSSAQKAVAPLIERAKLTLFMSGTLERNKSEKIAFLPYATDGGELVISLRDTQTTRIINYSRADALAERAIIPLRFTYLDGKAEWVSPQGIKRSVSSLAIADELIGEALITALKTQYAYDLLTQTMNDWLVVKKQNPRAKLLIVAATQVLAKQYAEFISKKFHKLAGVATMDEGSGALRAIRSFKRTGADRLDILATVGMAYEGLDVRPVTHVACLTRIRSKPWLEQMFARATRYDPDAGTWEAQEAHIFAPDDPLMHRIIDEITYEEAPFAKQKRRFFGGGGVGGYYTNLFGEIIPVGSGASGKRSARLQTKASLLQPLQPLTPSQREEHLRDSIEQLVREYAQRRHVPFRKVNARILGRFGKSRTLMRLDELQEVWTYVQKFFVK
jgi:superfamily II DNA or RNA helicase